NDDGTQLVEIFHYLLYLAPNPPGTLDSHGLNGQALFTLVGCVKCHITTLTTASDVTVPKTWQGQIIHSKALSSKAVNLYSDLLLHDMGSGLGDGIPMGSASQTQFRTTPLWGLSTRTSYMH